MIITGSCPTGSDPASDWQRLDLAGRFEPWTAGWQEVRTPPRRRAATGPCAVSGRHPAKPDGAKLPNTVSMVDPVVSQTADKLIYKELYVGNWFSEIV